MQFMTKKFPLFLGFSKLVSYGINKEDFLPRNTQFLMA